MLFVAWKSRHRSLETMYQLIQDVFSAEAGYSSTGRLGLNNNAFQMSEYRTGETGTSLLPTRGQATADSGRNRSTAGGYDVFAAGQARAYGPAGPLWHEEHALRRRACANVQQSVHSTGVRDVTSHVDGP